MIRSGFIILDELLEWRSTGLCTREAVESPLTLESRTAIEIFGGEAADQFRSERWENLKRRWYSITFAKDRDLCPGQQIALVESAYVLLGLMQELGEQAFRERSSLTIESGKGVKSPLIPARKPAYSMICGSESVVGLLI